MKKILVTGAVGQIGSELTMSLREKYGNDNVVAGGRTPPTRDKLLDSGPFETVDCIDAKALANVVKKYDIVQAPTLIIRGGIKYEGLTYEVLA